MAYTNFQHCTANEYKNIIYNQETHNKIKILFNNVELEDADEYCESFEVVSRVIPNGSKIFMLENLVSQEATLVLHNIDTSIIQDQVSISIGTLVSENTYEYVPIGIYNLQEIPTTDNGKTTIKLRDNSVKLDFNYNAKPLIDQHGGTATKLQILQDICTKAGITCNVSSFIGSSDLIGIYDNTITGRQYVAYLAGSAGAIPIITRSGALDFKYLNNLSTIEIPIEIVEQYSNAENFKISRVVYEDAIRKYESGNETYDTLFLDSANPYISSQEQVTSIYNIVNNFEINSFKTGRILGNPTIDSYDLIQITDYDGTIFKTFANNTLRYNGKMINTFASEISFERKKENVSLKGNAVFKKWAKTEIDNANAQITIQAGQINEIEQELANPTSIKEDKYFDLEDALDSPLIDFSLYGDTQQDSTTGKNLLGLVDGTYTRNSVTATVKNGVITLSGTNSSGGNFTLQIPTSTTLQNSTEYIFRNDCNKTMGSNAVQMRYFLGDSSTSTTVGSGETTRTTLASGTYFNVYVRVAGSYNTNGYEIKPMIRLASITDNSYEPYTNGASPNPDYPQPIHNVSGDNTIEIYGKNLYNASQSITGYISNTGTIVSDASNLLSDYITVVPNQKYTISVKSQFNNIGYALFSNSKIYVSRQNNNNITSITITIPNNIEYIRVWFNLDGTTTLTPENILSYEPMIQKGEVETSVYEEYISNSQLISLGDIELCKIGTYQDYIYKDNDRWFLHKEIGKVVLDGSERWVKSEINPEYATDRFRLNTAITPSIVNNVGLSNYFSLRSGSASDKEEIYIYNSNFYISIDRSKLATDDATGFQSWLSTYNTIVYCVLATPTDTEITDTTLLEQLNRLMTLPLYKNMTHITLTPNDLQPTMKIEYYRDTSINNNYLPKEEITKYYTKTETNAQINISNSSIKSDVAEIQTTLDSNGETINTISNQVQTLQSSTSLQINAINTQLENGVKKLTNSLVKIDANGINTSKTGETFNTQITNKTFEVKDSNKELAFIGYDNDLKKTVARMDDLESKRATIGVHRCETITKNGKKRTAWFYVGGGN